MGAWVGVDVGGTFTDFAVADESTGASTEFKVASTTEAPAQGVLAGFRQLIQAGLDAADIAFFAHGTTLALNTLLERSGARVGLITTRGFRDVLTLRRLRLTGAPGFHISRPKPLVPRRDIREVGGRLLADGTEVRALDEREVAQAAAELAAAGCEAIAICLLHSYRNDQHEHKAAEVVRHVLPQTPVSISSAVWPQQREYERTEVSVINAHISPVMRAYYETLTSELETMGVAARTLSTKSSGGVMNVSEAAARPVETLLSGPASGVVAACQLGRSRGLANLVAFDMGGTSADVGFVEGGSVRTTTEATVGDFPVVMPSVDVSSIGAGGGSIATVDAAGMLKVGPKSAGALPGPACYGRGGDKPTVTDAYAALGILTELLGGEIQLDVEAARTACGMVGAALGFGPDEAAEAILEVTTANMYARLLPLMAQRGASPREFALVAYGGAGPTHAFRLASELSFTDVVIPPSPGTFCALGSLLADLRADFVATVYADLDSLGEDELRSVFARLRGRAEEWVASQAVPVEGILVVLSADMRQVGQSHEIHVELGDDLAPGFASAVQTAFVTSYERVYGEPDPQAKAELVNARARVLAATPKPQVSSVAAGESQRVATRSICYGGKKLEAEVIERATLTPGSRVVGPAIICQYDTTTFVPPRAAVEADGDGNLIGGFCAS